MRGAPSTFLLIIKIIILIAIVTHAEPAASGQLHVQAFTVLDAHDSGEPVVIGTVVAVRPPADGRRGALFSLRISRVFEGAAAAPAQWKVGETALFRLDPGVEWTNPRKSPIERRLLGRDMTLRVGDDVIAVPSDGDTVQLLRADEANLRVVEIVCDSSARESYRGEERARLEADLENDNLAPLALAALASKGGPSAAALLRARSALRRDHYAAMDAAARRRFLVDAATAVKAVKATDPAHAKLRAALFDLALGDIDPTALAETAPILAMLDPANSGDLSLMGSARSKVARLAEDPKTAVDLTPLAAFIGAYEVNRPRHARDDGDLARIAARLAPRARAALATTLLGAAHTSSFARDGIDMFLLDESARLLVETPAADALPALAAIDPSRARSTREQERVLGAIARIGGALARAQPAMAPEAKRILDAAKARVPRAEVPAASLSSERPKAREETVTLAPGERRRLSGGGELESLRDPPVLRLDCNDVGGSSGSWSVASSTGYREWWACDTLIRVEDAGEPRALRIRATPMTPPPAGMEMEQGRAIADAALAGRGCGRVSSTSQDRDRGWMMAEASAAPRLESGANGKSDAPCRVLMGILSREVVRIIDAPAATP